MGRSRIFILKGEGKEQVLRFSSAGKYYCFLFNFSGEVRVEIEEKGVEVLILGVYLGRKSQEFSLSTVQHHKVGESISNLLVKGVFFDQSRFIYQGLIRIDKDAQKSTAYQKNQNLSLSDKVYVESRPFLEILANDVFCTHGSTTGNLNPEEIFYLKTRSLPELKAKKLLVQGFIDEVFQQIEEVDAKEISQLKDEVWDLLEDALESLVE